MEVAIGNSTTPFQREVREWKRIDPNTGHLLTGRLEADRWIGGPSNAYGKVVDSQNVSTPNGTQLSQRKQLEVLQTRTANGSVHVVRSHTVQTSRWSSSNGFNNTNNLLPSASNAALTNGSSSATKQQQTTGPDLMTTPSSFQHPQKRSTLNGDRSSATASPLVQSPSSSSVSTVSSSSVTNAAVVSGITSSTGAAKHVVGGHHNTTINGNGLTAAAAATKIAEDVSAGGVAAAGGGGSVSGRRGNSSVGDQLEANSVSRLRSSDSFSSSRDSFASSRGKSVSSEDLSPGTNGHHFVNGNNSPGGPADTIVDNGDDFEPCEWRRISKLRRSLQLPNNNNTKSNRNVHKFGSRPLDLPENLVSVSKIREELENGSRLDRAMRNNHVDLVALNNILKGVPESGKESNRESPVTISSSPTTTTTKVKKAATFLTSESLKEIRNKLRRLSDESLYKDDILNSSNSSTSSQQSGSINGALEEEAHHHLLPTNDNAISSPTTTREPSAFVNYRDSRRTTTPAVVAAPNNEMNKFVKSDSNSSVGSNSTSSLQGNRNEWHSRRKSYGFEKMTPPAETMSSFNCMESSTDSGIGRSGDLTTLNDHRNSPQSQQIHNSPSSSSSTKNGTIVRITNPTSSSSSDNYQSYRSSFRNSINSSAMAAKVDNNPKRHSIAVADDQKYLNDNLKDSALLLNVADKNKSQASANGFNVIFNSSNATNNGLAANGNSKRVEFCKTEVHFAAESGRVNIVETDGKPPPTNNFRRRRSSTQFLPDTPPSPLSPAYEQESVSSSSVAAATDRSSNSKAVVAAMTSAGGDQPSVGLKATAGGDKLDKLSRNEEEVDSNDEVSLRGILKNKPVKPKPYHLGENCTDGESLWGVRLRPVSGDYTNWMPRPTTTGHSSISLYKEPDSGIQSDSADSGKSVAERIRMAEEKKKHVDVGFATRVNLTSSQSFNYPSRDIEIDHEEVQVPTAISYHPQQQHAIYADSRSELEDNPDHNLKSTSLIMRTLRSANQFDEAMRELGCTTTATATTTVKEPSHPWTRNGVRIQNDLSRSSQLITNMNAITKSNSGNNWWRGDSSPSPTRRYSSSVDGDAPSMAKEDRLESIRQRRFSHESATSSSFLAKLSPASSSNSNVGQQQPTYDNVTNLKHVNHLNTLLEETRRLSDRVDGQLSSKLMHTGDTKKPIAAPRIKKIGSSSVMSQLTQLRRMYEAADEDSDTSTKADEEVRSYLGNNNHNNDKADLFSGSWSKIKAKRNSAILSDIRNDYDLHLGSKTATTTSSLSKAPSKDVTTATAAGESKPDRLSKLIDSAKVSPSKQPLLQPEAQEKSAPKSLSNHLKLNTVESKPKTASTKEPTKASSGSTQSTTSAVSKTTEVRPQIYKQTRSIENTPVLTRKFSCTVTPSEASVRGANEPGKKISVQKQNEIKLKLTSGTRQLRDHELSYFGVGSSPSKAPPGFHSNKQLSASFNEKHSNTSLFSSNYRSPTTTTMTKPATTPSANAMTKTTLSEVKKPHHTSSVIERAGQILDETRKYSERPDLLRHSPNADIKYITPMIKDVKFNSKASIEPIYENLKDPSYLTYMQRVKLKRDEELLEELARDADEILNSVIEINESGIRLKGESKPKSKSRPMDTIREDGTGGAATRSSSSSRNKMCSVAVQASATAKQPSLSSSGSSLRRHRTRMSSESSCENLTKPTLSSSLKASSRRSSRDHPRDSEVPQMSSSSRSSRRRIHASDAAPTKVRPSSRDTLKSSSEDLQLYVNEPRRPRRVKTKERSAESSQQPLEAHRSSSHRSSRHDKGERSEKTGDRVRRTHRSERSHKHSVVVDHPVNIIDDVELSDNRTRLSSSSSSHRSHDQQNPHEDPLISSAAVIGAMPAKSSTTTTTTYVLKTGIVPPPRHKRRRKVSRRNSSMLLKKREMKNNPRKKVIGTCICS